MSRLFKPLAFLLWLVAVSPSSGDVTFLSEEEIFEAWKESMLSSGFWREQDILDCSSASELYELSDSDAEFCFHALLSQPVQRSVSIQAGERFQPAVYVPADVYAGIGSSSVGGYIMTDGFQFVGPTPGEGLDPFHVLNESDGWYYYRTQIISGIRWFWYRNNSTNYLNGLLGSRFYMSVPFRTAELVISVPPRPGSRDGGCWGDTGGIGYCLPETYRAITGNDAYLDDDDGGYVWLHPFVWQDDIHAVAKQAVFDYSSPDEDYFCDGRASYPSAANPIEDAERYQRIFGSRMGGNPWE